MIDKNSLLTHLENLDKEQFLTACLHNLVAGKDLTTDEMTALMGLVLTGHCPDVLLSAIITALKIKGESVDEIASAVSVMRAFMLGVDSPYELVDIVGTGGDGANLFNVSTASTFVMATLGVKVAKHGSTGVSSRSGASDLLATAGVNLAMTAPQIAQSLDKTGIGFMFAPNHHPAMKHAKAVRGALKMRTIFNLLGPMCNPAKAGRAVIGAYSYESANAICQTMQKLGAKRLLVLHSDDGLDEISLAKPTQVFELKNNLITTYTIAPSDFGFDCQDLDDLKVENSQQSLSIITNALQGKTDPTSQKAKQLIALNAGAGLYVAGVASSLADGVAKAYEVLQSDLAYQKMQEFIKFSQSFNQKAD